VEEVANAVHVNVQLIRAATAEHLWAESYNRTLDDVFGVEGEVASAIADQLNAKLSGDEQKAVAEKPTQIAAAYDAYLRSLTIEHNNYNYDTYIQAERNYQRAVQLDPNFGLAWARMAILRSFLNFNAIDPNTYTAESVKQAADRAMALALDAGESWIALGSYRYRVVRDFNSALAAYEEARKRLPNNALVYEYLGFILRRLGRWQEAEASYKKAMELDPRDVQLLTSVGNEFYAYLRRFSDAINIMERKLNSLAPNQPLDSFTKAFLVQSGQCQDWLGQHEAARQMFERAVREIKPTPDAVVRADANGTPSYLALAYAGLN